MKTKEQIIKKKIEQIEKEQDRLGVNDYNYLRKDRVFGNDWVRLKGELAQINGEEK